MFYTNNGINFFLYIMSGQKFRTDLELLLTRKGYKTPPDSVELNTITSSITSKTKAK